MRLTTFEFNGATYHLLLNGAAMFDIYDRYGDEGSVMDHFQGNTREAFDATCWYLEKLSAEGERFRRWQKLDRGPVLSAEALSVCLMPLDVPAARAALRAAVQAGFAREEKGPPQEIDKGLLELEKKTGTD